jgi:hypothetical protein
MEAEGGNLGLMTKTFKLAKPLIVVTLLLLVGAMYWGYQVRSDYYAKVSVQLAAQYAEQSLKAVSAHYLQTKAYPASMGLLTLPKGDTGFVPRLQLDQVTGELTVEVISDHGSFGVLRFSREKDSTAGMNWRCLNGSVEQRFLPKQCQA